MEATKTISHIFQQSGIANSNHRRVGRKEGISVNREGSKTKKNKEKRESTAKRHFVRVVDSHFSLGFGGANQRSFTYIRFRLYYSRLGGCDQVTEQRQQQQQSGEVR